MNPIQGSLRCGRKGAASDRDDGDLSDPRSWSFPFGFAQGQDDNKKSKGKYKSKRRFPSGMTNKKSKGKSNRQYRGLSAAAAKARPPVEMTEAWWFKKQVPRCARNGKKEKQRQRQKQKQMQMQIPAG